MVPLLLQYEGIQPDDVKYSRTNNTAVQMIVTSYLWLILSGENGSEMDCKLLDIRRGYDNDD